VIARFRSLVHELGTIYQRQYAQHRLCCHLNDSLKHVYFLDIQYGTPNFHKTPKTISDFLPLTPKPEVQSKFGKIQIKDPLP